MLKPTSFSPLLAFIGILLYMCKSEKKKGVGTILIGFAVLMTGMTTMSNAVLPLQGEEWFTSLFVRFSNPILGVLVGALVTGIIQSSSASVGILQALSATGVITYGSAIPIIMGQNIGTCVTALISSVGANKNARRAAWCTCTSTSSVSPCFWLFSMVQICCLTLPLSLKRSLPGALPWSTPSST